MFGFNKMSVSSLHPSPPPCHVALSPYLLALFLSMVLSPASVLLPSLSVATFFFNLSKPH